MNGFQNEKEIINNINNNDFDDLSSDLKKSLISINQGKIPKTISAKVYGGANKADLSFAMDDNEYYISVKKGSGNSVHQEPVEEFIDFLRANYEDNKIVFDDLRHFIWGDLTLDGSGDIQDRIGAPEYKNRYPEKVKNIQSYFNKHKKDLLERFLVTGAKSKVGADYLFYGSINDSIVIGKNDLLDFAISIDKKPISIGVLTFQAWNRNLNGGDLSEKKRGEIQLKWGSLKRDLKDII